MFRAPTAVEYMDYLEALGFDVRADIRRQHLAGSRRECRAFE